jgi:heat shock protein HtpX
MKGRSLSIVARSLLALGLMVGFYAMAIGIAALLVYLPYAELVYADRLHLKLAIFCLVGAVVIIAAIIPRWDRFEPPGPTVTPEREPDLFATIRQVAAATGQRMPADVYVVGDVNAWVAQRGGVMGIGGRRVMGLGLPLLQALTVSELRAVLAHEFGHFHGGDTKVGRIVYQTRAAIMRTVASLAEQESWLQILFVFYAKLFLRVSHAVSRYQEYAADRLSASIAGSRALAEGLKKVHGASFAYECYWNDELRPVLEAGYFTPVAEGFGRYLSGELGLAVLNASTEHAVSSDAHDPYDTHPPLRERLAALRGLPEGDGSEGSEPAVTLLRDVRSVEWALIGHRVSTAVGHELKPIGWEQAVQTVYLPAWATAAAKYSGPLVGRAMRDLAGQARPIADTIGALMTAGRSTVAVGGRAEAKWCLGARCGRGDLAGQSGLVGPDPTRSTSHSGRAVWPD